MRKPIYKRVNRLKNRIRDLYGKIRPLDQPKVAIHVQQKKLVMTLLVRDEADVVRRNIEYHLRHGVDFIIATDNCSKDGTLEILREYEQAGRVHLIKEPSLNYEQATWVNRMGRIAQESYRADIIFHCDADEFWVSESGNLKNELIRQRSIDCLKVPIYHSMLINRDGSEHFPEDAVYFKNPDSRLLGGNGMTFRRPVK